MFDDLKKNGSELVVPAGGLNTEAQFHDFWCAHLADEKDLVLKALKGGMSSDRFAWIFLSGYQSAIKRTFPELAADRWSSFAVSEDRRGELPGLGWRKSEKGFLLKGYKTWVAAVDQMQTIIVKAGRGDEAIYLAVDREHPNLVLTTKEQGFLPEMSEGIACFEEAELSSSSLLSDAKVKAFGKCEILFIYLAFCGLAVARSKDNSVIEEGWRVAKKISITLRDNEEFSGLKEIDTKVQALRVKMGENAPKVRNWNSDQKLIAMYSKGIQSRPG